MAAAIDLSRWPVTDSGASLYWAGLNKAKRSVALALDKPEGATLARRSRPRPDYGRSGGIVLTNLPPLPGLDYASLKAERDDIILLRLIGNRDGTAAVDYTVNAASGFPLVTGPAVQPAAPDQPRAARVGHRRRALSGDRAARRRAAPQPHRRRAGGRRRACDVMLATVGHLGYIGDVQINGSARPAIGNDLYGSFGRDFATADGRRIMMIALTPRQWRALGRATGLADRLAMAGAMMGVDLDTETGRYEARDAIAALLSRWCAGRTLAEIGAAFAGTGVLWGPFQDFVSLVREDPRCSPENPLFADVEQPGIGRYPMPGLPIDFAASRASRPAGAATGRGH